MKNYNDIIRQLDTQQKTEENPLSLQNPFCWGIIGPKGSGKSTLLYSVIENYFKGKVHNIFLINPTYESDMLTKGPLSDLVEELLPDGKVFTTIDEEHIQHIIDVCKETCKATDRRCMNVVILDDIANEYPRRNLKHLSNRMFLNSRHLRLCVILVSQRWRMIPNGWRANLNYISLFKMKNKQEIKALKDEIDMDTELFDTIYEDATQENNSFLHINLFQAQPIFYKKFTRYIIDEE